MQSVTGSNRADIFFTEGFPLPHIPDNKEGPAKSSPVPRSIQRLDGRRCLLVTHSDGINKTAAWAVVTRRGNVAAGGAQQGGQNEGE